MHRAALLALTLTACAHAPSSTAEAVDLASTALGAAVVAGTLAADECPEEKADTCADLLEALDQARALVDAAVPLAVEVDEARAHADGKPTE